MPNDLKQSLTNEIASALKSCVSKLKAERNESFYYFTLAATGLLPPVFSAWSLEALDSMVLSSPKGESARLNYKWSYADSPYLDFNGSCFVGVEKLFSELPELTCDMSDEEWNREWNFRLDAMELAVSLLNQSGFFGVGEERDSVLVTVEVMPPDESNIERAKRLNSGPVLRDWLWEQWEETE